jgi:hypothetical protein
MKKCSTCKEEKDLSEFHKSSRSVDGYGYRCISCDRAARVNYREKNRERFLEKAREVNWKVRFGITREDYDRMLKEQGGRCAVCKTTNPNGPTSNSNKMKNFSVDHCHQTGAIRGLLCTACNRGIGLLGDTVEAILEALRYLQKEVH